MLGNPHFSRKKRARNGAPSESAAEYEKNSGNEWGG
jgi:hypothetical protein